MKRADKVIVINENLKYDLCQRGIKNISIIPNAVNLSLIKQSTSINNALPLRFGYIGSVSPIEGLDMIVRLWAKLEQEGFKNKFYIYGAGTFLEKLKNLKESLGVKNVVFKGSIQSHRVSQAFDEIDVVINPRTKSKISDTVTPLKPLEAMAYRKLVIASDVGGMKELIKDNYNGILFKSDSIKDLEKTIKEVINKGLDLKLIDQAQKHVAENKSWSNNACKYEDLYKKILG